MLGDPTWNQAYVDDLTAARAGFDAALLSQRVAEWDAQIGDSVADDPHRPTIEGFSYATSVASLAAYPALRAEAVDDWLDCRANGGVDADGDDFDSCDECDDDNDQLFPGNPAGEICGDGLDNNCDFLVDDGDEIACPPP